MVVFFFQAEDGIRGAQESRGLGDVYKRQVVGRSFQGVSGCAGGQVRAECRDDAVPFELLRKGCLLYTSDAADALLCVDLGGRRIINKKNLTPTNAPNLCYTHLPPPPNTPAPSLH